MFVALVEDVKVVSIVLVALTLVEEDILLTGLLVIDDK